MGNSCETKCCEKSHKLNFEIEEHKMMDECNSNRFKNLLKNKENFNNAVVEPKRKQTIIYFENGCVYEGDWDEKLKRHGFGTYK